MDHLATLLHLGAPQNLTSELLERVGEAGKCKPEAQLTEWLGLDSSLLLWAHYSKTRILDV